ncbi:hypothetical protein [Kribbella sp. NPDC000426]
MPGPTSGDSGDSGDESTKPKLERDSLNTMSGGEAADPDEAVS